MTTIETLAAEIVETWCEESLTSRGTRAQIMAELADPQRSDVPTGEDRAWAEREMGRELTDDEWSDLIAECRSYARNESSDATACPLHDDPACCCGWDTVAGPAR